VAGRREVVRNGYQPQRETGSVDLNGGGLSLHPVTLGGGGSVGNVFMQSDTFLHPGNTNPNTKLTMSTLGCSGTNDNIYLRIGNDGGGATRGTYLHLASALHAGNCPYLRFWLTSAGEPLVAGQGYLIAFMDSVTDYTTANLGLCHGGDGLPAGHRALPHRADCRNVGHLLRRR